jgi:hypothetical protein
MKILNIEDLKIELKDCWLWQYDQAFNLNKIMKNKEEFFVEYTENIIKSFIKNIFNLNTANEFGLEVWRRILGAKKINESFSCKNVALIQTNENGEFNFAFADNDGNLKYIYSDNKQFRVSTDNIDIETVETIKVKDSLYRRYLISKLMLYYMRGTLPEIQRYLEWLFPYAGVKVTSSNNMTYNINFNGELTEEEKALASLDKEVYPVIYGVESISERNFKRWSFWDGDYNTKIEKGFNSDETEEAIKENYPYTYIDNESYTPADYDKSKDKDKHGTNF